MALSYVVLGGTLTAAVIRVKQIDKEVSNIEVGPRDEPPATEQIGVTCVAGIALIGLGIQYLLMGGSNAIGYGLLACYGIGAAVWKFGSNS